MQHHNQLIRRVVQNILLETMSRHRCLNGNIVEVESQECYDDICKRIIDATETRNMCSMQSDSRDHHNGILKVLRRKHRKAKKFVDNTSALSIGAMGEENEEKGQ